MNWILMKGAGTKPSCDRIVGCILLCVLLLGCSAKERRDRVNPEFLLARGFVQSKSDSELFELNNVTLTEAARRLGFSINDLIPGTNNPANRDYRGVAVGEYYFTLASQQDAVRHMEHGLTNPDVVCSVQVRLIPLWRVDRPQIQQKRFENDPKAARDECVFRMETLWDMAARYRLDHKTADDFLFNSSNLQEYLQWADTLPKCPLSAKDYAPFAYASGPQCRVHRGAKSPEARERFSK